MHASIKVFLSSIVDYAGLFPPARLGMEESMTNYARDCMDSYNWMLDRFILPASRLQEFEALLPKFSLKQWSLGIILSENLELDLERVQSIVDDDRIAIASLEFPPLLPKEIERVYTYLSAKVETFFEIPPNADLEAYLAALQSIGAMAKMRTGGIVADAFPTPSQLGHYIVSFADAQIPFKATAGLHHLLRGNHPLTYEAKSDSTVMHGFLNVAIAAALAYYHKITQEETIEILKEISLDRFQFTEESIGWKSYQIDLSQIKEVRQNFFRSFGSCSFQEPINDLKKFRLFRASQL
jgi:hypothetical protein